VEFKEWAMIQTSVRSIPSEALGAEASQAGAFAWTDTSLKAVTRAKPRFVALLVLTAFALAAATVRVVAPGATQSLRQTNLAPRRDEPAGRTIRFPADRAMGILYVHPDETFEPFTPRSDPSWWRAWRKVGEARGLVQLPPKGLVRLDISRAAVADLSPLEQLAPDSLDVLNIFPLGLPGRGLRYVGHVKGLRWLHFTGAYIADLDRRLAHIAGIRGLERLSVWGELNDDGLRAVFRLKSLHQLDLSSTSFTGDGMRALRGMTRLESLTIKKAQDERDLAELRGLQRLRYLKIGEISDDGMTKVGGLANLEFLEVDGHKMADKGLGFLAHLSKLRSLVVTGDLRLSNAGLAHLSELSTLAVLSIERGRFTGGGLERLGSMRSLKELTIGIDNLRDGGLAHLANLPSLEDLSIRSETRSPNSVSVAALEQIARIRTLKRLRLTGLDVRGPGLVALGALPALESLRLTDADLTYEDLRHLGMFASLKEFCWSSVPAEMDPGRPTLRHLRGLTSMTRLELPAQPRPRAGQVPRDPVAWDAAQLSDLSGMTMLERLNLPGRITDEGLAQLSALPGLVFLGIPDADVTDEGLKHLSRMRRLQILGIGCRITDKGIAEFAKLESLVGLNLNLHGDSYQNISPSAIERVRADRPSLQYIEPFNGIRELAEGFFRERNGK
jgi:hypothetical protein